MALVEPVMPTTGSMADILRMERLKQSIQDLFVILRNILMRQSTCLVENQHFTVTQAGLSNEFC